MLGRHHQAITKDLFDVFVTARADREKLREALVRGSTFPDEVEDVFVRGRPHLLHQALAGCDHFTVADGDPGTTRGYCWGRDPTAKWFELPDSLLPVTCTTTHWVSRICEEADLADSSVLDAWKEEHPLLKILRVKGYCTAFDEITFASGAIVADWLYQLFGLIRHSPRGKAFVLGCLLHLVEDGCCKPHAQGVMLSGHTTYEAEAWETYQRSWKLQDRVDYALILPGTARSTVERAAAAGKTASPADASRLARQYCHPLLSLL